MILLPIQIFFSFTGVWQLYHVGQAPLFTIHKFILHDTYTIHLYYGKQDVIYCLLLVLRFGGCMNFLFKGLVCWVAFFWAPLHMYGVNMALRLFLLYFHLVPKDNAPPFSGWPCLVTPLYLWRRPWLSPELDFKCLPHHLHKGGRLVVFRRKITLFELSVQLTGIDRALPHGRSD